jgi:hypothetical protein
MHLAYAAHEGAQVQNKTSGPCKNQNFDANWVESIWLEANQVRGIMRDWSCDAEWMGASPGNKLVTRSERGHAHKPLHNTRDIRNFVCLGLVHLGECRIQGLPRLRHCSTGRRNKKFHMQQIPWQNRAFSQNCWCQLRVLYCHELIIHKAMCH